MLNECVEDSRINVSVALSFSLLRVKQLKEGISEMKGFTQIRVEEPGPIEFLFAADLEVKLHDNEDPGLGAHTEKVLEEMLEEARCQRSYSHLRPLHFIVSNGDENSRFDQRYQEVWKELESLSCPCYHVHGNGESATFGKQQGSAENYYSRDDKWPKYFGYEDTFYAWEYSSENKKRATTFIVLDTWCLERDEDGGRIGTGGTGYQVFRKEEKEWLKKMLDQASGLIIVFAHAHMWCPPGSRNQDNKAVDELIDILKGTYEEGVAHNHANVFFNGGHHQYPSCEKIDGAYFIDPIAGVHKAYARVIIDPVNKKMDYIGRFNEKSYRGLDLTGYPKNQ